MTKNRKKHKDINLNYSFKEIPLETIKKELNWVDFLNKKNKLIKVERNYQSLDYNEKNSVYSYKGGE